MFFILVTLISCSKRLTPEKISGTRDKLYNSSAFDYLFVEAIKFKLLGNVGEAMKYLEQCIKINPGSDAAYYQIAQILMAGGDVNNTKKYLLKAYSADNKNIWYLMMLAGTYYQQNNMDSAIIFYQRASDLYPERENLKITLGNLYSESKKYEKASRIFEELNTKYGINETSTVAAVKNYIEAMQYDKALEETLALSEKYPENTTYNGLLAEIYRDKGDNEKAAEIYDKMMQSNPDNPETQLSLCDFLIKQKKYDELLSLLNIVALNSEMPPEQKIQLFSGLIENKEIIKTAGEKLILPVMVIEDINKDNRVVKLLRPDLLSKLGKYQEAADRLEQIISEDQENYYAWEKLLLVYFDIKDYKRLQERAEDCATKFNRSFLAKLLYATGAAENKDYKTALEELRKAGILAGNNKEAIMQVLSIKADVYYKMKDYSQAFKTYEEAIKTDNSDITILNNYAYYLAEQNIKLKEAEQMAEQVIMKEPENVTFLDTYGWILYKRNKIREAQKIFEKILKNAEKPDAEYYEHYGYILKKKNDCKNAIEYWNKALGIDTTKTNLLKEIEKCGK